MADESNAKALQTNEQAALTADGLEAMKASLIEAYRRLKTPSDACKEIGIKRSRLHGWLANDTAFAEEYQSAKAEILDEVDKLLMKHAGMIPWTKEENARGLYKWSNVRSLELIRRSNGADQPQPLVGKVMTLNINGIAADDLQKLIAPRRKDEAIEGEPDKEAAIDITPEPGPKAPPSPIAELLKRKAAESQVEGTA